MRKQKRKRKGKKKKKRNEMGNDKIKVICFLTFIGKGPFCLYSVNFLKHHFICVSHTH